jgi:hypothetical protein
MSEVSDRLNDQASFVLAIVPQKYDATLVDVNRYERIIGSSQVRARGWSFPYYKSAALEIGPGESYCSQETLALTSANHIEQWRLYRSGQFLFRMKLWEAGDDEVQERMRKTMRHSDLSDKQLAATPGFISFVALIYSVSEAYVFAARLAQAIPYDVSIDVRVGLRNVRNWALASNDQSVDLYNAYVARNDRPQYSSVLALDALIGAPLDHATTAIQSLFRQFGWPDASPDVIANWQRNIFKAAR